MAFSNRHATGALKISDYLEAFDEKTGRGLCKGCQKAVRWSANTLGSHKRFSCFTANEEEKRKFSKRVFQGSYINSEENTVDDQSTQQDQETFDRKTCREECRGCEGLRNEMLGYKNHIMREIVAANAKAEVRFENLTTSLAVKFKNMQKEITNLRSEMPERGIIGNFVVIDNQEGATHAKISNLEQFTEMEQRLESSESAELHRQLVSSLVF